MSSAQLALEVEHAGGDFLRVDAIAAVGDGRTQLVDAGDIDAGRRGAELAFERLQAFGLPVRRMLSVAAAAAIGWPRSLPARAVTDALMASDALATGTPPSILWVMARSWMYSVEHCNGASPANLSRPGPGHAPAAHQSI